MNLNPFSWCQKNFKLSMSIRYNGYMATKTTTLVASSLRRHETNSTVTYSYIVINSKLKCSYNPDILLDYI